MISPGSFFGSATGVCYANGFFMVYLHGAVIHFDFLLASEVHVKQDAMISLGRKVRISRRCYNPDLHNAVGNVASHPAGVADRSSEGILWIEFEDMIVPKKGVPPIDGAEVDVDVLELL